MAAQAADLPDVVIPRVVWEHSSRRLLVMEWIEGIKVTHVAALRAAGIDVQRIADLLVDTYARQLFVHGFFHADPHPGNLFALPGDRLAIVDFGLTKRLTPAFRRSLAKLVRAMFLIDTPTMVEAFAELGFTVERGEDQRVWLATGEFFRSITDPSAYAEGAEALQQLNDRWARAVKANPFVAIPGDVTLVSRVFSLLTGVGAGMGAEPRVLEAILRYTAHAEEPEPARASAD
jgi:ubiquinone biosynthesis protein